MSYVRAEDVLPKELIETIQQYVNGKCGETYFLTTTDYPS